MKKIAIVLFASIYGMVLAQNSRFVYQVTMKSDSTAAPTVENAYLDVSPEKSLFYGEKRMQRDSIMKRAFQTRNFNFDRSQMEQYRTNINYLIEKKLADKKVTYNDRIARDQYSYDEDRDLSWKILPETVKIGEYKTQKAETEFAGRKWIAWFTQDIPFQDGPYKFYGLPGLIVKVEDSKGNFSFDLKETKKLAELPSFDNRFGNKLTVKRADYLKQQDKFRKDPMSFFQQTGGGGFGGGMRIETPRSSSPQNDAERRKRMEERVKEELKNNNNPIELK